MNKEIIKDIVKFGGSMLIGNTIGRVVRPVAEAYDGVNKTIMNAGGILSGFMAGYVWTWMIEEICDAYDLLGDDSQD